MGSVPESCEFGKGISPSVLRTSSMAVESIAGLLIERGIHCSRRHTALPANLWWLSEDRCEFVPPKINSQNQAGYSQEADRNCFGGFVEV